MKDVMTDKGPERISGAKSHFEGLSGLKYIEVGTRVYSTGKDYALHWQDVTFGVAGGGDFRSYLTVEPDMMVTALLVLRRVARSRDLSNQPTHFQWLFAKHQSGESPETGIYENLDPTEPRIVIYGDTQEELEAILTDIASNPEWEQVEQNRPLDTPLIPETNAFFDSSGRQWRSILVEQIHKEDVQTELRGPDQPALVQSLTAANPGPFVIEEDVIEKDVIAPPSSARTFRERWEVFTNYHPKSFLGIFGKPSEKSLGDLGKKVGAHTALGVLIRLVVGTAGVGEVPLAVIAGGSVKGILEHKKRVFETWERKRTEQVVEKLSIGETIKGFFNPDEKKHIALAMGTGATFGLLGNMFGMGISQLPQVEPIHELSRAIGGKLEGAVSTVREWRESWVLPSFDAAPMPAQTQTLPTRTPVSRLIITPTEIPIPTATPQPVEVPTSLTIEHSKDFTANVIITENSPEWIQMINMSDGEYGKVIQGAVGEHLSDVSSRAQKIAIGILGEQSQIASEDRLATVTNHAQHILEVKANEVFDSNLQTLIEDRIEKGIDLEATDFGEITKIGRAAFQDWLSSDAIRDVTEGIREIINLENEIKDIVEVLNPALIERSVEIPQGESFFEILFPHDADTNMYYLKQNTPLITADIAANYLEMEHWWHQTYPDQSFPAYLGELDYLMRQAEAGDLGALYRLRDAYKGIFRGSPHYRILSPEGVRLILQLLKRLG